MGSTKPAIRLLDAVALVVDLQSDAFLGRAGPADRQHDVGCDRRRKIFANPVGEIDAVGTPAGRSARGLSPPYGAPVWRIGGV